MALQCHRALFLCPEGDRKNMEYINSKAGEKTSITLRATPKELLLQIEEQMNTNKSIRKNPDKTYKVIIQNNKTKF